MIVTFIRHLWSSQYGATRERDLFAAIKDRIRGRQDCVELANNLANTSRLYAALLNTDHELWNEYGDASRRHMRTLILLRMEQYRPLLLAVLEEFPAEHVRDTLRLLVAWSVRFLIVGGLGGGVMERHYCARALDIRSGTMRTASELARAMTNVIPNDEQFRAAFESARVSQHFLARYYLRVLEQQHAGEEQPEMVPNEEAVITLEHVLPQTPGPEWVAFDEETAAAFYKRIGNLALLRQRINNELVGNRGFDAKKPFFDQSAYALTKEIAGQDSWGPDQIRERQRRLAELAVRAWPRDLQT